MADQAGSYRTRSSQAGQSFHSPGVISLLEVYTIAEAKSRLRWSDSALRAAKRRGLRLLLCGKRRYVTGREILRFLQSQQSIPSE